MREKRDSGSPKRIASSHATALIAATCPGGKTTRSTGARSITQSFEPVLSRALFAMAAAITSTLAGRRMWSLPIVAVAIVRPEGALMTKALVGRFLAFQGSKRNAAPGDPRCRTKHNPTHRWILLTAALADGRRSAATSAPRSWEERPPWPDPDYRGWPDLAAKLTVRMPPTEGATRLVRRPGTGRLETAVAVVDATRLLVAVTVLVGATDRGRRGSS